MQSCKVDPCVHYITVYSVRQCVVCVAPYLVNDGSCVLECPSGKYLNYNANHAEQDVQNVQIGHIVLNA